MAEIPLTDKEIKILQAIKSAQEDLNESVFDTVDLSAKLSKNFTTVLREVQKLKDALADVEKLAEHIEVNVDDLKRTIIDTDQQFKHLATRLVVADSALKSLNYGLLLGGEYGSKIAENFSEATTVINSAFKVADAYKKGEYRLSLTLKTIAELLAYVTKTGIDRFKELEFAAEEFRRETGLLKSETIGLYDEARKLNVEFANLGVTFKEAAQSQAALAKEYGSAVYLDAASSLTKEITLMSVALGVAKEDLAKVGILFGGIAKVSGETSEDLIRIIKSLSVAGQVAPKEVFRDIASSSSDTLTFYAGMPRRLALATIEARRMGTTIDSASKSARGLLNFQDSINAEMELSALLGKNVNFQRARELAFLEDAIGAREEVLNQLGTLAEFNRMSPFEKQAAARAAEMETGEIIKQLTIREQDAALRKKIAMDLKSSNADTVSNAKKLEELQIRYNQAKRDELSGRKKTEDQMAKERASELLRNEMASEFTRLSNNLYAIWTKFSDPISGLVKTLLPKINSILETIADNTVLAWTSVMAAIGAATAALIVFKKISETLIANTAKNIIKKIDEARVAKDNAQKAAEERARSAPWTLGPAPSEKGRVPTPPPPLAAPPSPSIPPRTSRGSGTFLDRMSRFGSRGIRNAAINLGLVGVALIPFAVAVKLFNGVDWQQAATAVGSALSFITGIELISKIMNKTDFKALGGLALRLGVGIAALMGVAYAMKESAEGFNAFAKIDSGNLLKAAGAVSLVMLGLIGIGALLVGTKGLGAIFFGTGLLALLGISLAMRSLAKSTNELKKSLSEISPTLTAFFGALTTGGKVSFVDLGKSIGILALALTALGTIEVIDAMTRWFRANPFENILNAANKAETIKNLATSVESLATSFGKLKDIPPTLISDISSKISDQIKLNLEKIETTAKVVLEVKNIEEVNSTIQKITETVAQLKELMAQQKPMLEVKTDKLEQKLDELISLMKSGAIKATTDISGELRKGK